MNIALHIYCHAPGVQASNEATVTLTPGAKTEQKPAQKPPTQQFNASAPAAARGQSPPGHVRRPEGVLRNRHAVVPGHVMAVSKSDPATAEKLGSGAESVTEASQL